MKLQTPDPRVLWSWETYALATAIPAGLLSYWLWAWERIPTVIAGGFTLLWTVLLASVMLLYLPLRRRRVTYGMDGTHLAVTGGVFIHTQHQMPLTAVRHVTLLQGPLERRFGTAFLWVAGAGGWILVEGVPLEQALAMRQRLLEP